MSLVARKQRQARERLLASARELIAEGGVEGLRLRGITDRAEIGFGSFYTHFASKEDLVEAVVTDTMDALTQAIIEGAATFDDPAEQVAYAHIGFIRLAYDDPALARLIVHLDRADVLLESATVPRLGPVLVRGLSIGRFQGVEHDVAINFTVGATLAVCRGILAGRLGARADIDSSRMLLQSFGLSSEEADETARRVSAAAAKPRTAGA